MRRIGIPSFAASGVRWLSAWVLGCSVLLSALSVSAGASGRVALVVGNAAYEHTDALRNPGNDASAVAAALGRLGFEVVLGTDLDLDGLYDKLVEFDAASRGAEVTLFFYAGHGLQVDGKNWLAPVDAKLGSKLDLTRGAVELDTVLEHMRGTKRLVYLDACRNNPLAGDLARSMGQSRTAAAKRGLARVTGVPGTFIGYATAPDDVAADGEGRHSPFTEALLAHIETPGLSVNDMFGEVSKAVVRATGGEQVPWSNSSLGRFHLASGAAPLPPSQGAAASAGAAVAPPSDAAKAAYEAAKEVGTAAAFRVIVEDFPGNTYAKLAKAWLDEHASPASAAGEAALPASRRFSELLGRPFSPVRKEDSVGWTDLHYAALLDLPEVVAALCDAGMEADARLKSGPPFGGDLARTLAALGNGHFEDWTAYGQTPLMIASLANARDAAAGLAACGAGVNATDDNGDTPLHWAAWFNAVEAAKLLIERGAGMEAADSAGETPLHLAAYGNGVETASLLIELGADVNAADDRGETPLHEAAWGNALETARLLIELGADVNATDDYGVTPLHYAAWGNALETASLLIELGADVNAANSDGETPLHRASLETARLLIDRGADVNAADQYGTTPLHKAAVFDLETARLLIDRGADVNAADSAGETPLHLAAFWDAPDETAELLIDRGADVNAADSDGETPLHEAAAMDALGIARLLIERGADANAAEYSGETPQDYASSREMQAVLSSRGGNAASPEEIEKRLALSREDRRLIQMGLASLGHDPGPADGVFGRRTRAALQAWQGSNGLDATGHLTREQSEGLAGPGREEAARLRAEAERDRKAREASASRRFSELLGRPFSPVRKEDSVGWTDLHYAALLDLPGAVAALCDAGMEADARLKSGTPFGGDLMRTLAALGHDRFEDRDAEAETPLIVASAAGARDASSALAACGADVNATDDDGDTPLNWAAYKNAVETARLLIDRGADMEATNNLGETPLHDAARKNAVETAKLLIDRGADMEATDDNGDTPLHWAAYKNAVEAARLLIDRGADMEATDDNGDTPLHLAAYGNAVETARLLIDRGARVNATSDKGNTPLHLAAWKNAVEAAKLLIDRGARVNAKNNVNGWTPLDAAQYRGHREAQAVLRSHGGRCAVNC